MAVGEQRLRQSLHTRLSDLVGADEAALLMEYLPPVGWADVATKRDLDMLTVATKQDVDRVATELRAEMAALSTELRAEMTTLRGDLRAEMSDLKSQLVLWVIPTMLSGVALSFVAARFT